MRCKNLAIILLVLFILVVPAACKGGATTTPVAYSQYELEYQLLSKYPDYFWCDPDLYPVAREGQEQQNAIDQFASIKANAGEFTAILAKLGLPERGEYTDAEKLAIYREHKKLTRIIQMNPGAGDYGFTLRTGQNQGRIVEGTITTAGKIKVTSEKASFNTCPICLTVGTLVDTPDGQVPVEQVQPGMLVWTVDAGGGRIAATVLGTGSNPVPAGFAAVKISLSDGRTVTASPGHPSSEGKTLGGLRVGDELDGAVIVGVERVPYEGATFDILPAGASGLYWANGILLKSTFVR